jgi:endonuclease/exonuclease/phosphatase family metal-dependent hydrolase
VFLGSLGSRPIRISSIHFDGEDGRHRSELQSHLSQLPPIAGQVDVVAGDFGGETQSGNLQQPLRRAGFLEALFAAGFEGRTRPYSTSNASARKHATVDHVLVRGAAVREGRILDNKLFERFPGKGIGGKRDENEVARIQAALGEFGTDHFPVVARLAF